MKSHPKAEMLTYAPDASGNLVYIRDLKESGRTNCHCPICNEPLIAKLGNGGRQRHFAHYKDSNCHGAYMTVLHMLAELIITEEKAVMAPAYKEIKPRKLLFKEVEEEKRNDRKDLQPDRVGITEDNKRWCIEIRNTHEVDEVKIAKYKESNLICLEIDVRKQSLDKKALTEFLLESTEDREWINNPFYDELIAEAERERAALEEKRKQQILDEDRKKVAKIVKLFEEKRELPLQPKNLRLKEVSASISKDGLYAKVQVVSEGGKSYIIHIGSEDKLMRVEPQKVCDELKIDTAQFHSGEEPISFGMKWFYCHVLQKKQEEKIEEYSKNPDYEIRPSIDCIFDCHLKPINGNCIYIKDTFEKNGIKYVVCHKAKRQKEAPIRPQNNNHSSIQASPLLDKLKGKKKEKEKKEQHVEGILPFDQYWTIEDYFEHLQSTGSYKRFKDQDLGEIVECDLLGDTILVLYKIHVSNGFVNQDVYYIDKVSIENGEPLKKNVDFYRIKLAALTEYSRKKDELNSEQRNENNHNNLPF